MIPAFLIAPALGCCGWAIWSRRKTWRIRWDRALTLSVLLQAFAFALCAPITSSGPGHLLFVVTGTAHLDDYFGHLSFIAAAACVIYACAGRVAPDDELEPLMRKVEFPGTAAAALMLIARTLSNKLSAETQPDFLNLTCDTWLAIYWLIYGAIVIYLLGILIKLLLVLRQDPRSQTTANLFIISTTFGIASITALIGRVIIPGILSGWWVWVPLCVSGYLAAAAAALSWRRRTLPFTQNCKCGGGCLLLSMKLPPE